MLNKKLTVILPNQGRDNHKEVIVPYLHYFLRKQEIDFKIYIVTLDNDVPWNKGIVYNSGFLLVKDYCDYLCFHDIDMLPVECDYSYDERLSPIHLATKCSQYQYKLLSNNYYGGVLLFHKDTYESVNGFATKYFKWGKEDNDLYKRVKRCGYEILRRDSVFECLVHTRDQSRAKLNQSLLEENTYDTGLSTTLFYLNNTVSHELYTEYFISYDLSRYNPAMPENL